MSAGKILEQPSYALLNNGEEFIKSGKNFLGNTMKMSFPLMRRGVTALMLYDLVQQVKELQAGNKDALVNVISNSIFVGSDLIAAGVEIAEMTEIIAGVSAFTGPIGEVVGAIAILGAEIYRDIKQVEVLNKEIHLTGTEKFREMIYAFLGVDPKKSSQVTEWSSVAYES